MIKVTITSSSVREMKGIGKASGKPYHMCFQTVWAHTTDRDGAPQPFPEKLEIVLDKGEDGHPVTYPVGEYQLHPSSLYVKDGALVIAPRLQALKPRQAT